MVRIGPKLAVASSRSGEDSGKGRAMKVAEGSEAEKKLKNVQKGRNRKEEIEKLTTPIVAELF